MVLTASAKENVLRIPETIAEFKPKRMGHVEHASQYKLDFWSFLVYLDLVKVKNFSHINFFSSIRGSN